MLEWQRNQNGTYYAEHADMRLSVARSPGIREWVLKINGLFHSHRPTKDAAMARADAYVARRSRPGCVYPSAAPEKGAPKPPMR